MVFGHRIQVMPIHRDTTTFGGRLHACMDDLGLPERGRQAYISQRFKVSQPTAKGYLDNKIMPGRLRMLKMASEFGVMLEWLSAGKGDKLHSSPGMVRDAAMIYGAPDIRVIPLVSYVEAGAWSDISDPYPRGQGMESIGVDPELAAHLSRVAFALKIEGLSMAPEFQPGDVIIVDPNTQPRPGDLVVAKLDDEESATFKKYRDRGTDNAGERIIELVPLNPDYPTLHISASTPGRIIATMIEHRRRRRF